MHRRTVGLIVAAAAVLSGGSITAGSLRPGRAEAATRTLPPGPLYGVTVDDVSSVSAIVAGNGALPVKPTTRVYLDPLEPASSYTKPVAQIAQNSYVMAELLDSADMRSVTPAAEHTRVAALLSALGGSVDIWEVGNEVNGNWTGAYSTGAQMITDAYDQVKAAGGRTALTVWYNAGCAAKGELDPITYANTYLSAAVRNGLDYVLLSYYQSQCNGVSLSSSTVTAYAEKLHAVFPNASVGFGEIGLPRPVSSTTQAAAIEMIDHYYRLPVDLPYYVGGYFWWYYAEDALPYADNAVWDAISRAMPAVSYQPTTATSSTTSTTSTTPASITAPSPTAFSTMSRSTWRDGSAHKGWVDRWNGYGTVGIVRDAGRGANVLSLSPAASTSPTETHSALVTTKASYTTPTFSVPVKTVAQLRQGSTPNPWEVGWVMWNFASPSSYYNLVLKPNGWEVDRGDPTYPGGQHFLASGTSPAFKIGAWYRVGISQTGSTIAITVNGSPLATVQDPTATGPLTSGRIGLYSEDATVRFGDVVVGAG